ASAHAYRLGHWGIERIVTMECAESIIPLRAITDSPLLLVLLVLLVSFIFLAFVAHFLTPFHCASLPG
ncbi:MAG: hypothetical protein M3176_13410, partial [Chloroflexota bacterium]|nr:hypothetical protein [Chloroflexota bacterium]